MDDRQWAQFVAQSGIQADRTVKTFTPTSYAGFSVDPSGELSYLDFGVIVQVWSDGVLTGTSDDVMFTLSGLPVEIQPRADRIVNSSGMVNNATNSSGEVQVFSRDSVSAGTLNFAILRTDVVANFAVPAYNVGWTNSGTKGLASGWMIQYAK